MHHTVDDQGNLLVNRVVNGVVAAAPVVVLLGLFGSALDNWKHVSVFNLVGLGLLLTAVLCAWSSVRANSWEKDYRTDLGDRIWWAVGLVVTGLAVAWLAAHLVVSFSVHIV